MTDGDTFYTRSLHADFDTPISAYLKLAHGQAWSFLYESVEGSHLWNRFSIIGIGRRRSIQVQGKTFIRHESGQEPEHYEAADALEGFRNAVDANAPPPKVIGADANNPTPAFVGGWFGYVGYDCIATWEPITLRGEPSSYPDALLFEPEVLGVFDRRYSQLRLYARETGLLEEAAQKLDASLPRRVESALQISPAINADDPKTFEDSVQSIQESIRAGDLIQAVLSRKFILDRTVDPFDVYRGLRTINPSPYLFFVRTPEVELAGSSPEIMVRVERGEMVLRPIAGTRPRGKTPAEDQKYATELLADQKEIAEHIMLVDLGRNDVGRVANAGSVHLTQNMIIEHYSHVMHIVSEVTGTLKPSLNILDALKASFPAGTLSGAPKVRAMQHIAELEGNRRGIYGGAVGYMTPQGDGDFGIAIRTLIADKEHLVLQAGAGIVLDSNPVKEREETEHKAQAVIRAAQWAASKDAAWPSGGS